MGRIPALVISTCLIFSVNYSYLVHFRTFYACGAGWHHGYGVSNDMDLPFCVKIDLQFFQEKIFHPITCSPSGPIPQS